MNVNSLQHCVAGRILINNLITAKYIWTKLWTRFGASKNIDFPEKLI